MKILHLSDTHGILPDIPELSDCDIIIHSGDFFPNEMATAPRMPYFHYWEEKYQLKWLNESLQRIVDWTQGKYFLFCGGNHDFLPSWQFYLNKFLNENKFINLNDRDYYHYGINFSGFQYVNYIAGHWNFELPEEELEQKFSYRINEWKRNKNFPDILVTHSTPFGFGDLVDDKNRGLKVLSNYLNSDNERPKMILSGHFHKNPGIYNHNEIKIINSATTYHILEI